MSEETIDVWERASERVGGERELGADERLRGRNEEDERCSSRVCSLDLQSRYL